MARVCWWEVRSYFICLPDFIFYMPHIFLFKTSSIAGQWYQKKQVNIDSTKYFQYIRSFFSLLLW